MDKLNPHQTDNHDGIEVVAKKRHEKKLMGVGRKPFKNAILYACDFESAEVYRVKFTMEKKMVRSTQKDFGGGSIFEEVNRKQAHINPDHELVWASNDKTAVKKFEKMRLKAKL